MVRLKGLLVKRRQSYLLISIPYGAIKRVKKKKIPFLKESFQFLMVRLKVELQ